MQLKHPRLSLLAFAFAAGLGTAPAHASLIVIPGATAGVEQGSPDSSPLGGDGHAWRFQMVYGAGLLGGLTSGDIITGLTFRIDAVPEGTHNSALPAQTVDNYEIRLSTSVNAPGSMSLVFADNRGADEVIVRSGALTIGAGDFPGGGEPNAFGSIIAFTAPFVYTGGPLLIEIAHDGFDDGRFVDDSDYGAFDGEQVFGEGFAATGAPNEGYVEPQAMPIQLEFTRPGGPNQNQLAAPSVLNLFGTALAGLLGFGVVRRQRRIPR
jgi:hypothetical protein